MFNISHFLLHLIYLFFKSAYTGVVVVVW